jgi:hypothetical protein
VEIAEVALAERTLEARVRPALFRAAETHLVALEHAVLVGRVDLQVIVLGAAAFARADGVVVFEVMRVERAEPAATVLAGMLRPVPAPRKPASNLACPSHLHPNRPHDSVAGIV